MTPAINWADWLDWLRAINPVDLVLGGVVLASVIVAWSRGFVAAGLQLLTLAGSVALAFFGYRYPAAWLESQQTSLGPWIAPLSFLAAFVVARLILGAIAHAVIRAIPARVHVHGISRLLAVAPGLACGLVNATVLSVLLLLTVPLLEGLTSVVRASVIANRLAVPAEWIEAQFQPIFDPAIRRTLQALTVQPGSSSARGSQPLPAIQ